MRESECCPMCESVGIDKVKERTTGRWGDRPDVEFDDEVWRCVDCGEEWYDPRMADHHTIQLLKASLAAAETALAACETRVEEIAAQKDGAYLERNRIVAALAATLDQLGYRVGVKDTQIEGWEPEWNGCVYIDGPTGQLSWHFHESQRHLFAALPPYEGEWDGHTTDDKYERIAAIAAFAARAPRP